MLETVLIFILSCLVVLLSVLLVRRYRAERKTGGEYAQFDLTELRELIKASSSDESIQQVAGYVSKILRESCDCSRILFFRKRRRLLELNYFYGVNKFNRRDLRISYSRELVEALRGQVIPESTERIRGHLSEQVLDYLRQWGCELQFPVFWRDHLYGLYFVSTRTVGVNQVFKLMVATLAQSLAAAYHTRWQEERHTRLTERLATNNSTASHSQVELRAVDDSESRVLKLLSLRNSDALIQKIAEDIMESLPLERFVLVYESRDQAQPLRIIGQGLKGDIQAFQSDGFNKLLSRIETGNYTRLDSLGEQGSSGDLDLEMKSAGLRYVARFPLSDSRTGLFAWEDSKHPRSVASHLKSKSTQAVQLVENAETFERVEELSYTDNLTGLANRRFFQRRLIEEMERAQRHDRKMALIMFDLDELKGINDRYGHQAGDSCIKQMGELLKKSVRSIDVIARYGGDEFCIVMPETDAHTCARFMSRLQSKVANHEFRVEQVETAVRCSISQGGSVYPDHAQDPEQLIYASDMALLKAKESGRNRYKLY